MELIMRHLPGVARAVTYMASKGDLLRIGRTVHHVPHRYAHTVSHTDWNRFGERTVQRSYDCSMRLFAKRQQPDALVCADDAVAFRRNGWRCMPGLRVPEDVRIVGFDDSPLAATTMPTLTSVQPQFEQIVAESPTTDLDEQPAHPRTSRCCPSWSYMNPPDTANANSRPAAPDVHSSAQNNASRTPAADCHCR